MEKIIDFEGLTSGLEKEYYNFTPPFAEDILKEGGISLADENITPPDLFSIPEGVSLEEKQEIIAKNLDFKKEDLKERLPEISRYWQEAKEFYRNFLMPKGNNEKVFPQEIEKINKFSSVEELIKILGRAATLKKGDNLGFGPLYCALFTLMIAAREFHKEKFEGLTKESKYFVKKIFSNDQENAHFKKIEDEDDGWSQIEILTKKNEKINAWFSFRGKSKNSILMKLATKPEFTVEERIKDGIGLKFEVESEEDAKKLFLFLPEFFSEKFSLKIENLVFENVNLFKENKNFNDFIQKMRERQVSYIAPGDMQNNEASNKRFRAAKIFGTIKVPENGEKRKKIFKRNFEVQVVLTNNENETGLAQHKIYKQAQKLFLFSRLFGSFGEDYLDSICQEASKESGLNKEKIKEYFKERFLVKIQAKNSKEDTNKYVAKAQVERWLKAGVFPKNISILKEEKISGDC